jgi:catechol-2,3-dioxygenase
MMKGGMVFMRTNTDHHCLALVGGMKEPNSARELHHLAFEVPTLDEVVRARAHLRKHRVKVEFHGRRRAGCQVAVEFRDPDGHFLEIFWGLDQVGSDDRVRPPSEWREEHSLEAAIANAPPGQDMTLHGRRGRKKR